MNHTIDTLCKMLNLEKHCEGGYFKETYRSKCLYTNNNNQQRNLLTSIYYLVTQASGMSCFALNQSDLLLYHHQGDPMRIIFIDNNGNIREEILGSDIAAGHQPQIYCPANQWKAYDLMKGEYALIGEAVAPGFDYEDMQIMTDKQLQAISPKHYYQELKKFINQ